MRQLAAGSTPNHSAAAVAGAPRVLILGGTGEARQLAALLAERPDVIAISSLAGRTTQPTLPEGLVRIGGFGGVEGLVNYLRAEQIAAVLDATHPFATQISAHAELACRRVGVPLVALVRPPWTRAADDLWHEVPNLQAAAAFVESTRRKIFLSIGRQELRVFAGGARSSYVIRAIEPPPVPLPLHHTLILSRGPFTLEQELMLLRDHEIDVIVSKHSGGSATYPKIVAARHLRIPVVMVMQPRKHSLPTVSSVAEALAELDRQLETLSASAMSQRQVC